MLPRQIPARRRPGFWLAYGVLTTLLVTGATEAVLRLLDLPPRRDGTVSVLLVKDPYIGYKPRPNTVVSGAAATREFTFTCAHNSLGFRDVEHTVAKPPGVFRILGLGDSFTYGIGAPSLADSYLAVLETLLNGRAGEHPGVEVIKMGVMKFFPEPERLTLEHYGLGFSPDLVLVGFVPNDVSDTFQGLDSVAVSSDGNLITHRAARLGKTGRWLFVHSNVARILLPHLTAQLERWHYPIHRDDIYRAGGRHEADWRKVEEELGKMMALCRRAKARLVLVHIPEPRFYQRPEAAYPAERLASWAGANGAYFVDTLPALRRAAAREQVFWPREGHCTPAGYRVVAEAIGQVMIEQGLVP